MAGACAIGAEFGTSERKLIADGGVAFEQFGWAVAIESNLALIGAPHVRLDRIGSAYLYDLNYESPLHVFASDRHPASLSDWFGTSVAICDGLALIGAPLDSKNTFYAGAVYAYEISSGLLRYKFAPDDLERVAFFGGSLATDGSTVLVGASNPLGLGEDPGAAYVFDTATGSQRLKLTPPDGTPGDLFGHSVAIEGNLALIGAVNSSARGEYSGAAYLFDVQTGDLLHKFVPSDIGERDSFGSSVAINGGLALIGARRADGFGFSSGAAYLFDVNTGEEIRKITGTNATADRYFGTSVALDDGVAVVAGYDVNGGGVSGSVWAFDAITGTEFGRRDGPIDSPLDGFGRSVALDEGRLLIGAPYDSEQGESAGSAFLVHLIPEPTALAGMLCGSLLVGIAMRRRITV